MTKITSVGRLIDRYKFYNRFRKIAGQIFAVLLLIFANPSITLFSVGFSIIVLGESIRVWALGYIKKDVELATIGPYRFVRHPLYVGNFLIATGFLVIAGNVYLSITLLPLFFLLYHQMIQMEEEMLWIKFGKVFEEYSSQVRKVIPTLKSELPNNSKNAKYDIKILFREHEYNAFLGIFLIIILLFAKEVYLK